MDEAFGKSHNLDVQYFLTTLFHHIGRRYKGMGVNLAFQDEVLGQYGVGVLEDDVFAYHSALGIDIGGVASALCP